MISEFRYTVQRLDSRIGWGARPSMARRRNFSRLIFAKTRTWAIREKPTGFMAGGLSIAGRGVFLMRVLISISVSRVISEAVLNEKSLKD